MYLLFIFVTVLAVVSTFFAVMFLIWDGFSFETFQAWCLTTLAAGFILFVVGGIFSLIVLNNTSSIVKDSIKFGLIKIEGIYIHITPDGEFSGVYRDDDNAMRTISTKNVRQTNDEIPYIVIDHKQRVSNWAWGTMPSTERTIFLPAKLFSPSAEPSTLEKQ